MNKVYDRFVVSATLASGGATSGCAATFDTVLFNAPCQIARIYGTTPAFSGMNGIYIELYDSAGLLTYQSASAATAASVNVTPAVDVFPGDQLWFRTSGAIGTATNIVKFTVQIEK